MYVLPATTDDYKVANLSVKQAQSPEQEDNAPITGSAYDPSKLKKTGAQLDK
jgi:hypothetical protein